MTILKTGQLRIVSLSDDESTWSESYDGYDVLTRDATSLNWHIEQSELGTLMYIIEPYTNESKSYINESMTKVAWNGDIRHVVSGWLEHCTKLLEGNRESA